MQSPIRPAAAGSLGAVTRIGVTASTCKKRAEQKPNARRNEGRLYGLVANLLLDGELLSLAQREAQRWVERSDERERLIEALSARTRLVTVG